MVKTHIDSIVKSTWQAYGYSCFLFLGVIFGIGFGKKFYELFYLINPVILICVGLAEFITAKACRFKPYMYGAFVMWFGALACAAVMVFQNAVILQLFILSVCMITGFVIPGYLLNKLAKKNV